MPTALSVGTTTFREVSIDEVHNKSGLDALTVTLKGRASELASQSALWTKGVSYSGYPNMSLETKSVRDQGPVCEIILNFTGFISSDTPENGLVDKQNDIALSSVSLTSSGGDNVQFSYYGQITTYRWVYRGIVEPQRPKFSIPVPTEIPVGYLFSPFPASFAGSVTSAYAVSGRCSQFNVTRLSPSMWAVIESWSITVEPVA
jgi:hypothetical protein